MTVFFLSFDEFFSKLDNIRLAPLSLSVDTTPAGNLESVTVVVSFEPFFRLVHFFKMTSSIK